LDKTKAVEIGQKPENVKPDSLDLAELTKMYDFTGKSVPLRVGPEYWRRNCRRTGRMRRIGRHPGHECGCGKALIENMGERGKQLTFFKCDVLNRESIGQTAQEVVSHFGKLDCLINGAGGNKPQATTSAELKFFDLPTDAVRWSST